MRPKIPELKNQLTPRQLQLLKALACFQQSRCYSPTIAELSSELGISRSTAFEHIAELQKKHLLQSCRDRARSLKLTSETQKLLSRLSNNHPVLSAYPPTAIPLGRLSLPLLHCTWCRIIIETHVLGRNRIPQP